MKQISIVFSKYSGFSLFSELIMLSLDIPFSHVSVQMVDGDTGQVVYYQASGLVVNCVSEAEFLSKETVIYRKDVQVSDAVYIAGKTFAINQLGKPYDNLAVLGFALQILLGCIGIHISNPAPANDSEYVCSQFAAAFIDAADDLDLDVRNMTPKALHEAMSNLPTVWQ